MCEDQKVESKASYIKHKERTIYLKELCSEVIMAICKRHVKDRDGDKCPL